MKFPSSQSGSKAGGSFLPEDYLAVKAARRTNLLGVALFIIVTFGVIGAFFVTNRQWNDVRQYQESVNVRYATAAAEIEQLKDLEQQEGELLDKAELTAALIERVPRTTLLAELINRGPEQMTLLEVEVESERTDKRVVSRAKRASDATDSLSRTAKTSSVRQKDDQNVILAPEYRTTITIIGVAPKNQDVAAYLRGLQQCSLLRNVEMLQSKETIVNNRLVHEFRIEADLDVEADARSIEPVDRTKPAFDGAGLVGVPVEEDTR
jgi:Tfp pilus assembly protein PilN